MIFGGLFSMVSGLGNIRIFDGVKDNKLFRGMKNNMTIKQAQDSVDQWINTTGVRYFDELTNTAILMEEVGEVARIMARKYGEQSFKAGEQGDDLADEFADVLFVLICLANQTGVDLTEALIGNIEKKTKRDGERHQNNRKLR
jgi:NTP pyrophosphatase (non-canonical NTP hydrolase)